jgi:hypothetical protein
MSAVLGVSTQRALAQGPDPCAGVERCGPMDVVFLLDNTGSMGGAIANVQAGISQILQTIDCASSGDYHLGLISYGNNVHAVTQLGQGGTTAANQTAFLAGLSALPPDGGGGEPEAANEAFNTALNNLAAPGGGCQLGNFTMPWRASARKIIINITDARPTDCSDLYTPGVHDVQAANMASLAASRGVLICSVYVPTNPSFSPIIVPILQNQATVTGGGFTQVNNNGTGSAAAMNACLAECGGDGVCATFSNESTLEEISGTPPMPTGCFFYTFQLTNNTAPPQTVQYALISSTQVTPNVIPLNLAPGATSAPITVKICGVPVGDTFTLPLTLMNIDNEVCCLTRRDVVHDPEDCFQMPREPQITCSSSGCQLSVTVQPMAFGVGHVFAQYEPQPGPSLPPISITNSYIPQTIPQFGTQKMTFNLSGGVGGNLYCFRVFIHTPDLAECCSRLVCVRLPIICGGDPNPCGTGSGCDSIDFNNDGVFPDTTDINDFLSVFSGGPCSGDPLCNDIDFNNDGVFPDNADIDSFLSVLSGGSC